MRILVVGMSRSGSTWLFNAVAAVAGTRLVCTAHGHDQGRLSNCLHRCGPRFLEEFRARQYCIAKIHKFAPALLANADVVLASHRNVHDVLVSSMLSVGSCLLAGTQPVLEAAAWYLAWLPYACFDMAYGDMMANAERTLRRVARLLEQPYDSTVADRLQTRLKLPGHVSGMMAGHVSNLTTTPGSANRFNVTRAPLPCNIPAERARLSALEKRLRILNRKRNWCYGACEASSCPLGRDWRRDIHSSVRKVPVQVLHARYSRKEL